MPISLPYTLSEIQTSDIPKFNGTIYYVNATTGADTNDGLSPEFPFATIGAAITATSAGDAISIHSDTYTETGLDVSDNAVELWCETGAILAPATGTALTISGNYCRIRGVLLVLPGAGETGVLISGNQVVGEELKVSEGGIGLHVTGDGLNFKTVACGKQTIEAYKIEGASCRIEDGSTVGVGATIGYHMYAGADVGVLRNCTSVGHETSGYQIDTGCADWTIKNCSSGAGDGRWSDADNASTWPGFTYDDEVYATTDFSVVGGAGASQNLFKVTGAVQILGLRADVETVLHADVDDVQYTLWDGTASTDITDVVDSASAPVESLFAKEKKTADALVLYSAAAAEIMEEVDLKKAVFGIVAKAGVDTYIRFTWTGTGATGVLHHHIKWEPLTEDGFVTAV